jgi:hypothetical protein
MSVATTIPMRFQRSELELKADLTPAGLLCLSQAGHPERMVHALIETGNARDALYALVMMLPHRQSVWWACLAARTLPDLAKRPADLAAVDIAERWVQSAAAADAEQAGAIATASNSGTAPGWVAMAAFWAGPSLAPRGQQPVPPAPHLPGVAVRTALLLLTFEPSLDGRATLGDWLEIGVALMNGENGRQAQAMVRDRLFAAA